MPYTYSGSRYEILGPLGDGGTSNVYRARDLLTGRSVALKVLPPEGNDPAAPARFLARREFRLLASQSHPGIVRVFDYGTTEDGLCYFSMEALEGPDLLAFARALGSSPEAIAPSPAFRRVMRQLLDAVYILHRRGITHRDLKPSIVLVVRGASGRDTAKLIDFGFAGAADGGLAGILGTVEYLAPERIHGQAADPRSDLYALGVVMCEVLTGQCPFGGASAGEVVRAHL